ncbi:MAG: hypothetical protein ACPGVO_19450, partial [Spirulinaceae cyanobacterium]
LNLNYSSQAEVALIGLTNGDLFRIGSEGFKSSFQQTIQALTSTESFVRITLVNMRNFLKRIISQEKSRNIVILWDIDEKNEFASLARKLAVHWATVEVKGTLIGKEIKETRESTISALNQWADLLEGKEIHLPNLDVNGDKSH